MNRSDINGKYKQEPYRRNNMKYKTPLYPFTPVAAIIFYVIIIIGMLFDPTEKMAIYTGVPTTIVLLLLYKMIYRNKKNNVTDKAVL
jgi:arginine/ornithine permease